MKKIKIMAVLLIVLLCMAACQSSKRPAEGIAEEIVLYYGYYGDEAADKVDKLFGELRSTDKAAADRWEKIYEEWKGVNNGTEVHYGILPDGLPDTDELCLVALGFQLNPDGSMKKELVERLKVVAASAEKYPNALIVCTGGGTAKNNKDATEAGKMAEWLKAQGISGDRILVEDKSLTTAQNAQFTYEMLKKDHPEVSKVAIISSDYHIATGTLFFDSCFLLNAEEPGTQELSVVSNAAYKAPSGTLTTKFQAGGLIELTGDVETAYDIYYNEYDIHELPDIR